MRNSAPKIVDPESRKLSGEQLSGLSVDPDCVGAGGRWLMEKGLRVETGFPGSTFQVGERLAKPHGPPSFHGKKFIFLCELKRVKAG